LEFIAKAENLVLVGPPGVGKTGLASGLLLKALENGYRCQFIRAQDLFGFPFLPYFPGMLKFYPFAVQRIAYCASKNPYISVFTENQFGTKIATMLKYQTARAMVIRVNVTIVQRP
jgi:GTPase SAR1 family protein